MLLAGDDRQLDAIGSGGGALSMLAGDLGLREAGAIHELRQVRRFRDADGNVRAWEASASLDLREGYVAALSAYDDHGRIVGGSQEAMIREVVDEIVAAHLEGKSSALVVGTGSEAAGMSWRVRTALIDAGRVSGGALVALRDGTAASVGDHIVARENSYEICDDKGVAISNRDTLVVTDIGSDGSIVARRRQLDGTLGQRVKIVATYAQTSIELAYAATIHASQGRTVDVSAVLVDPAVVGADLASLYVGLTRGRESNRAYVVAESSNASLTPVELLAEVVERSERAVSATEMKRSEDDAAVSLARIGPVWNEAMTLVTSTQYRTKVEAHLEEAGLLEALRQDPATPAFWDAAAGLQARGIDPADAVASTLAGREVNSGRSVAQVLHFRLETMASMAWKPAKAESQTKFVSTGSYLERSPEPESLARDLSQDHLGIYARHLATVMDARVTELGRRTAAEKPEWATKHLGPLPRAGISGWDDWTERAGAVAAYREHYCDDGPVDVANPIGRAPSARRDPGRYAEWSRASAALNLGAVQVKDPAMRSNEDLGQSVRAWSDAVDVAPQYVKPLLADAHREHRLLSNEYAREAARAKVFGAQMKKMRQGVEDAAAKVADLQARHDERGRWYEDTTALREEAQEARSELLARKEAGLTSGTAAGAASGRAVPEDLSERQAKAYDDQVREQQRQQERSNNDGMSMEMEF